MYLTRLQALGFKSFAQKLDMPFQKGITCVVGPNGCGKSNVVDALRWALGEQRPRSLRSGSMGDVIFLGRARASLGHGEVSLTLDNSQKVLPTEFSEVTLTRRLFRSGESDYLITQNSVSPERHSKPADGHRAGHAIVLCDRTGMVDEIISDNAEERRRCFEEAAGVTRYKIRRKSAWNRLISVRQDLQRMEDWLGKSNAKCPRFSGKSARPSCTKPCRTNCATSKSNWRDSNILSWRTKPCPMREEMAFLREDVEISETQMTTLEAKLEEMRADLADRDRVLAQANAEIAQHVALVHRKDREIGVAREEVRGIRAFFGTRRTAAGVLKKRGSPTRKKARKPPRKTGEPPRNNSKPRNRNAKRTPPISKRTRATWTRNAHRSMHKNPN